MDLNDIALFVTVVRAGTFAEAGRRLGMPPSTASRRVQDLERELGTRLMHRTTRRLALTEPGRAFYAECAGQVDGLLQSAKAVADGSTRPAGKIRVAAPADFFGWFPAAHVARFLAEHPLVRLEFLLDDAPADLLAQGIDIALRGARVLEPGLIARQVGWSRTALLASPSYLAARGIPDSPQALGTHDCITIPTRAGRPVVWKLECAQGRVEVEVSGRFQASSFEAQLHGAVAGLGVALLPVTIAAAALQAGQLRQILPEHGLEIIGFYVVFLSRRQLPRAISAFVDFLSEHLPLLTGMDPVSAHTARVRRAGG
jgi:DNA-binding transcriptional LysR family regulator